MRVVLILAGLFAFGTWTLVFRIWWLWGRHGRLLKPTMEDSTGFAGGINSVPQTRWGYISGGFMLLIVALVLLGWSWL